MQNGLMSLHHQEILNFKCCIILVIIFLIFITLQCFSIGLICHMYKKRNLIYIITNKRRKTYDPRKLENIRGISNFAAGPV